MQFEGDPVLFSGLLHQRVSSVCVTQALGARRDAWAPCATPSWMVRGRLCLVGNHVGVVPVVDGVPKAVAKGCCAAA